MNTGFTIGALRLKNRVMVASGTFGYGDETLPPDRLNALGAIITKSLSMKPRDGNPPTRIVETASGMLNSIGLANIGVKRFIDEKLPFLNTLDTAIIANVAASTVDEYCAVVERLSAEDGVDGFEINVSCPNVKEGGLSFGTNCAMVEQITRRVRAVTTKPIIMKLTPNVTHISEFARAAENAGADAVSAINTFVGMAINATTRTPVLSTVAGGLSGPAIKPLALAKVYEAARSVKIPVIGIGGIMNTNDALEFLIAGASAIQVGTANFVYPDAAPRIAEGLDEYCSEHRIEDLASIVGSLDVKLASSVLESWL